jgi:predicted MFS family arabinose efflux permease
MTSPDLAVTPTLSLRRKWLAMAAMGLIYYFSYFQRAAVPGPLFDQLQSDLDASASAITALSAMFIYIYGGLQLFVGMAAYRFGGRRTLLWGGLVMAVGAVLFPLAYDLPTLFACRALTGCGASFMFLSIIKEVDRLWDPRHFVVFWGLFGLIGNAGVLTAAWPLAWFSHQTDWRTALFTMGVLSAVALAAAWLALRGLGEAPHGPRRPLWAPILSVLRNRASRPILVITLIYFAIYFVVQVTLGSKFLADFCGLSATQASLVLTAMVVVGAVIGLLGEPIQRLTRQRRKPVFVAGLAGSVAAVATLTASVLSDAPPAVFVAAFLLLSFAVGLAMPVVGATMKELNDPAVVSQSIAVINCLSYIGLAVLSNVVGLVLDAFADQAAVVDGRRVYPAAAYVTVFALMTVLSLATLIAALFVPETRGKSRYRALGRLGVLS